MTCLSIEQKVLSFMGQSNLRKRVLVVRTETECATEHVRRVFGVLPKLTSGKLIVKKAKHYQNMPEFYQPKSRPFAEFKITTSQTVDELSELLQQRITEKTKSVWFPKRKAGLGKLAWIDDSGLMPRYPIYVISKGRPQCITARALKKMGVSFSIVIEPKDSVDYHQWREYLIVGDFDTTTNSSIPVRNWVDDNSVSDKYWLIDDNIEDFNILNRNQKFVARTPVVFRATEDFSERFSNVGQAGLNYYSFAKKTEAVPPYYCNTRIYSCTLMDRTVQGVRCEGRLWRGRYNEDTDLSLRILKAGYCTLLMNQFLAGKITTQRVKGGNTDSVYTDGDNRLAFAKSLQNQHPDCVDVVWKFNRWHHKVNYRKFKQELNPIKDFDLVDYKLRLANNAR